MESPDNLRGWLTLQARDRGVVTGVAELTGVDVEVTEDALARWSAAIAAGRLADPTLSAYDRMIGLDREGLSVDELVTKSPCVAGGAVRRTVRVNCRAQEARWR